MRKESMMLMVCILLTSCAKVQFVPSDLKPYLEQFEKETGLKVETDSFTFKELTRPVIGQCDRMRWHITLDPLFWAETNEEKRVAVLWHEIGHCMLGLNHPSPAVMLGDCSGDIMNAVAPTRDCAEKHFNELKNSFIKKYVMVK